ncbi:MAG: ATP-dependent helicase [Lachnospiraceae bacterium]|nr:ATP-dependent helicase [Lachnospiraceae bacterium]
MKVRELSNALIDTRAVGTQTGISLKVRELSNALIDTRAIGTQTGISVKVRELSNALIDTRAVDTQTGISKRTFKLHDENARSRRAEGSKMEYEQQLNDAQLLAASWGEGPALVLAGPGSGKTHTIMARIHRLIKEEGVPPDQILSVTFSKAAALSMADRFGDRQHSPLFSTFHALFYHILQRSNPSNHTYHFLSISDKKAILLPIMRRFGITSQDPEPFMQAISYYKNTLSEEDATQKIGHPWSAQFKELFTAYETERKRRNGVDYDDMAYECKELLSTDQTMQHNWQKAFSYILIDEFQDINPIQYQLVKLLSPTPYNLFAVGDDDQSIYGFRGSDPSLMKRFQNEYQAKLFSLNLNYRSRPMIVKGSLYVISLNHHRFQKDLHSAREVADSEIVWKRFATRSEQYAYIQSRILSVQAKEWSQYAVLFRTNLQMQGVLIRLEKEGIPYQCKEKVGCVYDHFLMSDLRAYLEFALGNPSRGLFLRFMNKPNRWIDRELLCEEIVDWQLLKKRAAGKVRLMEEIERLEKGLCLLRRMKPQLAIRYILQGLGYERYVREKAGTGDHFHPQKLQEWGAILDFLKEDAAQYVSCEEWWLAQDAYRKAKPQRHTGGVSIMTVHASKGLEFNTVLLPDINEGFYPHGYLPDEKGIEEECRLLYVGMTRAKESLELLSVTGSKEAPIMPSRFLKNLRNQTTLSQSINPLAR